jgi:hypothetical protein
VLLIFGTHTYGQIEWYGRTRVGTRFFHLMFVPFFPMGSVVMLDDARGFAVPTVWRSAMVGYAEAWSILGIVAAAFSLLGCVVVCSASLVGGALVLASGAVVLAVALVMRRWVKRAKALGRDALVERFAYNLAFGLPVDPAVMWPIERRRIRESVLAGLARETGDYRGEAPPWEILAREPGGLTTDALARMIALARIDESFGYNAPERPRLRAVRARQVAALGALLPPS